MIYPKMQSLWKRDRENNGVIMECRYSREEFKNIKRWRVSEKVDGTNIRIMYDDSDPCYGPWLALKGRTERAQLPQPLFLSLEKTFTLKKMKAAFPEAHTAIVFGEGYGVKIQKGGGDYRSDNGFIAFDVWIDGWWLERDKVKEIADLLEVQTVPEIGIMKIPEIVEYVRAYPKSLISERSKEMEGIVARSSPLVLYPDIMGFIGYNIFFL